MKVHLEGFGIQETAAIQCLLYPYEVELTKEQHGSDLVICKEPLSDDCSKPQIRTSELFGWNGNYVEPKSYGNGVVGLPFDLIADCAMRVERVLNPNIALIYKIFTRMPFQYKIAPSSIRSRFLRTLQIDSDLSRHLTIEVARKILIHAVELLGFHLRRKNPASLLITHDVDTPKGLSHALSLKKVETKLDMKSTWFLVSNEYDIPPSLAKELGSNSTIGSHDVRHDGKLIHIRRHDELIKRLRMSRLTLGSLFERDVDCFRSPLMQFSERLVSALGLAGYRSDFSLPCWEPVHPASMSGFGAESVHPLEFGGVVETPLTLFQDHQVLNVMGLSTREAVKFWVKQAKLIRQYDGDLVLLIHPDYSFSQDLGEYGKLITSLSELMKTDIPAEIS